jgi:hypothetical protein
MRTLLGQTDPGHSTSVAVDRDKCAIICHILAINVDHLVIKRLHGNDMFVVKKSLLTNHPSYIRTLVPGVETMLLFHHKPSRAEFYPMGQRPGGSGSGV